MPRNRTLRRRSSVDAHVGARIRLRRTLLGMSQHALGDALGLSFQQMQKYEQGTNRVAASRLYDLSRVLEVPVSFFFEHLDAAAPGMADDASELAAAGDAPETAMSRETLELVRAYYRIDDRRIRHQLLELTKAIANSRDAGS